jgi:sulfite reductase beta subunit-like hemoprotein
MTHNKADTFAHIAEPLGFIAAAHPVEAARRVVAIFRDHGNRTDRRHARLKYLLADWGIERFREEFRRRVSFELADWRPIPRPAAHDHLDRHPQGNGTWFYGIYIENGRIIDRDRVRIKTALRKIVSSYRPGVSLTPHQNLLLTGLDESTVDEIEKVLTDHGVTPAKTLSGARRYSMACPALPTCGLAMADSERRMPDVVAAFERELESLGLRDVPITLRMTGCPNGCARPYTADIAFVGRRPEVYHVYVGGGLPGDRVADLFAADVATDDLLTTLRPLLTHWAENRQNDESLSDYYQRRMKRTDRRTSITGREEPTMEHLKLEVER